MARTTDDPTYSKSKPKAKDDVLANYPEDQVARWYGRLADFTEKTAKTHGITPSVSAMMLRQWLKNRKQNGRSVFRFPAPLHVQSLSEITAEVQDHLKVYLSRKEVTLGSKAEGHTTQVRGIVPRLRDPAAFKIDPTFPSPVSMHLEKLIDLCPIPAKWIFLDHVRKDIFTGFGGFQLRTEIELQVSQYSASKRTAVVSVKSLQVSVNDEYDWNYNEYLTMPNPDHNSVSADAIESKMESIRVYHSNAQRLEQKNLAWPYPYESDRWSSTQGLMYKNVTITF
ncbi:MAG: hypothetical protein JNK70_05335 [Phycisphaerae bacterium]|nr:hypothetical protein [Phycisphaerae bacterium]